MSAITDAATSIGNLSVATHRLLNEGLPFIDDNKLLAIARDKRYGTTFATWSGCSEWGPRKRKESGIVCSRAASLTVMVRSRSGWTGIAPGPAMGVLARSERSLQCEF